MFNGTMVQIPHELQVNNEAGQQGAAIWKMREKGAKLIMPFLCMRNNCYVAAAVHPDGTFVYDGYCGQEHRSTDPYVGKTAIEGVTQSVYHRPTVDQAFQR